MSAANGTEDEAWKLVSETLKEKSCNDIIQISHHVDKDFRGEYFEFSISILRIDTNGPRLAGEGGIPVTPASVYRHDYRYPRTPAAFDDFHTGTFSNLAYADMKQSGALLFIRKTD